MEIEFDEKNSMKSVEIILQVLLVSRILGGIVPWRFLGVSALVLASVVGCSGADEGGKGDLAEEEQEVYVPRVWVIDAALIHVLGQMFEVDEGSVAVLGSQEHPFREYGEDVWETNLDFFLDSGLLQDSDGGFEIDTSLSASEAGQNISRGGSEITGALGDTLRASPVTWCGDEMSGVDFAQNFYERHYGKFDTHDEYVASIEEYVECEAG